MIKLSPMNQRTSFKGQDNAKEMQEKRTISYLKSATDQEKNNYITSSVAINTIHIPVFLVAGAEVLARVAYKADKSLNLLGLHSIKAVQNRLVDGHFDSLANAIKEKRNLKTFVPGKALIVIGVVAAALGAITGYLNSKSLVAKAKEEKE